MDQLDCLSGHLGGQLRDLQPDDSQLLLDGWVPDEQVQAATFESFAELTGVIARQKNQWPVSCGKSPQLRYRHLEITEDLQQKGFEFSISPVDLIDQ